jgi:hypothetical protein
LVAVRGTTVLELLHAAFEEGENGLPGEEAHGLGLVGGNADAALGSHDVPHDGLEAVTLDSLELQPDAVPVGLAILKFEHLALIAGSNSFRQNRSLNSFTYKNKRILTVGATLIVELPPKDGELQVPVDLVGSFLEAELRNQVLNCFLVVISRLSLNMIALCNDAVRNLTHI